MARKIPRHSDELLPREEGFFYSFNVELTGAAAALLPQRPATEGSEVERRVRRLASADF